MISSFQYIFTVSFFIFVILMLSTETSSFQWTKMEEADAVRHHATNSNYVWGERVTDLSAIHECKFYINNKNMNKLEDILKESSDPQSKHYGKHTMTKQEIEDLTSDPEANHAINEFLTNFGITVTKHSSTCITAQAPLSAWENALKTQFFVVRKNSEPDNTLFRCREYQLPVDVAKYVNTVMGTFQLPAEIHRGGPKRVMAGAHLL